MAFPAAVDEYLTGRCARWIGELGEFLAIPSISALSAHRADMERAAAWLAGRLRAAGLEEVRVDPLPDGHPVVRGGWHHLPGAPTLLLYGHYDVQPVDPESAWTTPPFTPTVRDGAIYARGASDDKGQVLMQVLAVEAWLRTVGRLPLNVEFLVEGEEEIGSPHLGAYVAAHQAELAADAAVISDTPMYAPGVPALCYGLRGLCSLEVEVRGPAQDLHSGVYGGAVANPAHALAAILGGLHDAAGRVTVPGFYDGVVPLSPAEREEWARLPFSEAGFLAETGAPDLFGEAGYTTLERIWGRPTLEVNGLWSGFTGEGRKTIIPARARAKLSCRLVPDQDPGQVLAAVADAIRAACPPGVEVEVLPGEADPAILLPREHPAVLAARRAVAALWDREPAFIRMGGSIPVVDTFQRNLGLPSVLLGFALPDEHFHAPDEHFHLDNFLRGARTLARLWQEYGDSR
ncbi:MAG: dipeptidase [Firmicutes bacterium]|nr:dipeptidase [Bacillota bacterium]